MALLAIIIYTVALSLVALKVGAHLALALDRFTPTLPFRLTRRFLDPLIVVLAGGCWLGAIFLSIWPPDRPSGPSSRGSWANEVWRGEILFALVFAPVGCLLRYYASLGLNPIAGSFPLGTFAVNVFGCAVEAMCYSACSDQLDCWCSSWRRQGWLSSPARRHGWLLRHCDHCQYMGLRVAILAKAARLCVRYGKCGRWSVSHDHHHGQCEVDCRVQHTSLRDHENLFVIVCHLSLEWTTISSPSSNHYVTDVEA
jgi:hypothetical protein